MKKKSAVPDFEELMKGIDWNRYLPAIVGIMQPVVIFGAWLAFSKVDNRADALSKLITLAEPIPTLDLNIPAPVVLASLYHSVDELADVIEKVIEFIEGLEIPSAADIIADIKKEIKEEVGLGELTSEEKSQMLKDYAECKAYADLFPIGGSFAFATCMARKGWSSKLWQDI